MKRLLDLIDPPKKTVDQIVNAGIMAGLGFFSTLAGMSAAGLLENPASSILAACISAGLNFFSSLAIQRGLKKD